VSAPKWGFRFVPLAEIPRDVTGERSYKRAQEELDEFLFPEVFADFQEFADAMLYDHKGFWVMQRADCNHLREQFRAWKAIQLEEKQSEAGRQQAENLNRGKTKAPAASGKKSRPGRKKKA
jgi:hypothetical protein